MKNKFSQKGLALRNSKGFTLIEMLVVIGIIGLLASVVLVGLGNARKGGRDARRIADVRSVQSALEAYYNSCAHYPAEGFDCDEAVTTVSGNNEYDTIVTIFNDPVSGLGVPAMPHDPTWNGIVNDPGDYQYGHSDDGQSYVIGAVLETSNNVLNSDIDDTTFGIVCDSTAGDPEREYCIQQ